jgi:hypothetical protein
MRILIIDDSPSDVLLMVAQIRHYCENVQIHWHTSMKGGRAEVKLGINVFDLVLVDYVGTTEDLDDFEVEVLKFEHDHVYMMSASLIPNLEESGRLKFVDKGEFEEFVQRRIAPLAN